MSRRTRPPKRRSLSKGLNHTLSVSTRSRVGSAASNGVTPASTVARLFARARDAGWLDGLAADADAADPATISGTAPRALGGHAAVRAHPFFAPHTGLELWKAPVPELSEGEIELHELPRWHSPASSSTATTAASSVADTTVASSIVVVIVVTAVAEFVETASPCRYNTIGPTVSSASWACLR